MTCHMTHLDLLQVNLQDGGQLLHAGVLIDGHEYLVEQCLEVVSLHPVHDEALQGRHHDDVLILYRDDQVHQPLVVETCEGGREGGREGLVAPDFINHFVEGGGEGGGEGGYSDHS